MGRKMVAVPIFRSSGVTKVNGKYVVDVDEVTYA